MKKLDIILTPKLLENKFNKVFVSINLVNLNLKENDFICNRNLITVGIPFLELSKEFYFEDDLGEITVSKIEEDLQHIKSEKFLTTRDTVGNIKIEYEVILKEVGKNPIFDLGFEDLGMNGSGMTFLPYFAENEYGINLSWNRENLPDNYRTLWSYGENDVKIIGDETTLCETFYYSGDVKSVQKGNCGFHWFEHEGFDGYDIGNFVMELFVKIAEFFKDKGEPYQVFGRKLPENLTGRNKKGGTALKRSFGFVYAKENPPSSNEMKFLFPHEMVHNWARLDDGEFGTCTWYVEGTAEFYSIVLADRFKIISKENLVEQLNKRAKDYYENPRNDISNMEAGRRLFKDSEATLVPYGRGFFYLLNVDEQIRLATNNEKSLDDIVLSILDKTNNGEICGNSTWLSEVKRISGLDISKEFEEMQNGKIFLPKLSCFNTNVEFFETNGTKRETDEPCILYQFR